MSLSVQSQSQRTHLRRARLALACVSIAANASVIPSRFQPSELICVINLM